MGLQPHDMPQNPNAFRRGPLPFFRPFLENPTVLLAPPPTLRFQCYF